MTHEAEILLDRCIDLIRSGGNPEDALREDPQAAEQVRPLLTLVSQLESLPDPQPSVEGMTKLAVAIAARQKPARRIRLFSPPVLVRVAAALVAVLFLGWGSVALSSNTVPGDLLYPVKRLTEHVKFFLTFDAENQVELRIVFSEERLKEAVRKHRSGEGIDKALLTAMLDEAKHAVEAAPQLSGNTRDLMVTRVAHMTELQHRTIEEMTGAAAGRDREDLRRLAERCAEHCMTACRAMGISEDTCPMCRQPVRGADMNEP